MANRSATARRAVATMIARTTLLADYFRSMKLFGTILLAFFLADASGLAAPTPSPKPAVRWPWSKPTPTPKPAPTAPAKPTPLPRAIPVPTPIIALPHYDEETSTRLQIFLDNHLFAPGKIDGEMGEFFRK